MQIKNGRVSSVDYARGCANVIFDDEEGLIKTDVPFLAHEYKMPSINDHVLVILDQEGQGYIIGSVFSNGNIPEVSGKGVYFKRLSDKSYIRYDPKTDTLELNAGKVIINNLVMA